MRAEMRKCMKRTGEGSEIQEKSGGRERQHKGKAAGHRSGVEATVMSQSCSCSILRANSSEKDRCHMSLLPKCDLQVLKHTKICMYICCITLNAQIPNWRSEFKFTKPEFFNFIP